MLGLGVVMCIPISYVNSFKEKNEKKKSSDQRTGMYFSLVIFLIQLLICVYICKKCRFVYENTNSIAYL